MLYMSERNYGCRFMEIRIFEMRTLVLENECIRVSILLDKGTDIIEFNYKKKDIDFAWRSPIGLSCLYKNKYAFRDNQILTDTYTGGWFEAFPNVGQPCVYKGANIPMYGELCYLPWEYTVIQDTIDCIKIKCFVRTTKTPFSVEKFFTIKTHDSCLLIEEEITNLGRETCDFQWGHHPNFGKPFLDEFCEIDMADADTEVLYSGSGVFEEGLFNKWPFVQSIDGAIIDISKAKAPDTGLNEVIKLNNLKEAKFSIYNKRLNAGIKLEWDHEMFGHNAIWHVTNGDEGYPRYGDTYVLGFVIRSDINWGLDQAVQAATSKKVKSQEKVTSWIKATPYE
jgi:hypothetical protein